MGNEIAYETFKQIDQNLKLIKYMVNKYYKF